MNDIEKRKKLLLRKIKELGIIDICDVNSLEDMEQAVDLVEKHNKEYPPAYHAAMIEFIEAVREGVWAKGDKFSRFYFDISDIVFWGLKNQGLNPKKCGEICEKILDTEKLFNQFSHHISV
jgi:hypothetical protein